MPREKKTRIPGVVNSKLIPSADDKVSEVLASLQRLSTKRDRENIARFAVSTDQFFGVSMTRMKALAKKLGRNHELAGALWQTGWYEARMLASLIDDPVRVTAKQMDRWCGDFDNWAICDTVCFALFDRTPYAWRKVSQWARRKEEFVKRAAFALIWSLTVHDTAAGDDQFLDGLRLIERAATDERHFVKKAVNMALRAIGKRNRRLHVAALEVAQRLGDSEETASRWIGKDAIRELNSASVSRRLKVNRGS